MARQARIVVPGYPHHVVHRGNLRAQVFFSDDDRRFYVEMLGQCAAREGLRIWAYCLMGNHVHLIVMPEHKDAMARGIGLCHQRYASAVNARSGWTGNLWANRFSPWRGRYLHSAAAGFAGGLGGGITKSDQTP